MKEIRVAVIFGGQSCRVLRPEIEGGTAHFGAYAEPLARHIRATQCGELAQTEDEWGPCDACPVCKEETIVEDAAK